ATVGSQGTSASGGVITITNLMPGVNGTGNNFGEVKLPPQLNPIADTTIDICDGQSLSSFVSFTDAALNMTWTATVDYGDGGPVQIINLGTAHSFTAQHSYTQHGVYQVTVTITDALKMSSIGNFLVTANAIPLTAYNQLVTINDGSVQDSMIN